MTPWPGAFTYHNKTRLKVLKATPISKKIADKAGTILSGFPDELLVATGRDALSLLEIQGPSGKRLAIEDVQRA